MSWSREAGSPAFLDQEQHGLLGLSPALLPRERVGCTVPRKQEAVPLPSEHSCNGGLCSWSVPRPLCRFCGQGLGAPLLAPSQPSVSLRVSASRGRLPPLHPQHPLRERAGGPQVLVAACESHQDPRPPRRASLGTASVHRHPCLPQFALHASLHRLAPFTPALPLVLVAACESHQDLRPPRRASLGTAGVHRHPCLPQLALHASLRRLAPFTPALPLVLVAACESHQDPRPPRRASLGTAGAHRHPCLPQLALHASVRRLAPFAPLCLWPCLCPLSPGLSWEPLLPAPAASSPAAAAAEDAGQRGPPPRRQSLPPPPRPSNVPDLHLGGRGLGYPGPRDPWVLSATSLASVCTRLSGLRALGPVCFFRGLEHPPEQGSFPSSRLFLGHCSPPFPRGLFPLSRGFSLPGHHPSSSRFDLVH